MTHVLEVTSLRKEFGDLVAVDNISFDVPEGEIFGFLGPNGAGKTTSISMICGLLKPTSGEVRVQGVSIQKQPREVKRNLGVVPQEVAIYEELSARQNLVFWGGIYALRGNELKRRVDELLEQVGLDDRADEPTKNFSGGMKRRLNLAMGLINDPKLILLDEPTVGIDPQARRKILDVVAGITAGGRTVLYTTHYLEEAEELCDRVAIMDHGKILALGNGGRAAEPARGGQPADGAGHLHRRSPADGRRNRGRPAAPGNRRPARHAAGQPRGPRRQPLPGAALRAESVLRRHHHQEAEPGRPVPEAHRSGITQLSRSATGLGIGETEDVLCGV